MKVDAISVVLRGCERDEDVARWDEWIGRAFLLRSSASPLRPRLAWIVRMTRADVLVGIMLVATRFPGVHEIVLLSKEHNSAERGVGTRLLQTRRAHTGGAADRARPLGACPARRARHFGLFQGDAGIVACESRSAPASDRSPGVADSPCFASVLMWTHGLARACPFSTCTAGL